MNGSILQINIGTFIVFTSLVSNVLASNSPPVVSAVDPQTALVNTTVTGIPITVDDAETPPEELSVWASSSNPSLLQDTDISVNGSGADRTLELRPVTGRMGTASVTVTASDGEQAASSVFVLMVTPSESTLLYDSFGYSDGVLISNAPSFWTRHSGTAGQLQVVSGAARLSSGSSEDVSAPLGGGSFSPEDGQVLYAAFTVVCRELPASGGGYFAHFNSSGFRARVFASTSGAAAGFYRIGVANNSTTANDWPADLSPDKGYRVVIRYLVDSGQTTLWVDPADEGDVGVDAADAPSPATISAFALRQGSGIGELDLSDLRVAFSFDEVLQAPPLQLRIAATESGEVALSWPADRPGFVLQSRETRLDATWTDVGSPAEVEGERQVVRLPAAGAALFRLTESTIEEEP